MIWESIRLSCGIHDRRTKGAEQTVSLLQGPAQATSREVSIANSATAAEMEETIDYVLDLEQIPGLKPGAWIDFTVVALDYKPQLGTSAARRLTLISPEQLDERLSQRQADILTQISEVARLQSETRSQVAGLRIQLEELQRLNRDDVDHLQSVELNQRQVSHRLGHPVDGVLSQIAELLAELKSNRVDNTEVHRRMAQVADVIRGLVDGPLPAVQQEFVKTLKIARDDLAERDSQSVASAATRESVSCGHWECPPGTGSSSRRLEKLLGEMSEWDSYRQLAREVGRLRREQKETRRQTEQLRLDTLALDLQAMSSAQRAEQRRLTERQSEISRNFDRLQSRMIEMRERLEEREPLAAATLRDAIEAAQNMALGGMLRDAGDQLRANRLGKATDRQSEIVDGLGHLQDLLANRRENTLDRVLGQLRDAAAELSELEKRQKDVRNRLEDPENHTDPALRELANKERDLAEQIQRLAARLERLQARQAGDMLQLATQALKDASVSAGNGDVAATQRNADLAADRMLRAQQQIQQSLGQTQQDLLREQLVRYQQLLTGVLQGQQSVLQDTQRLDRFAPHSAGHGVAKLEERYTSDC